MNIRRKLKAHTEIHTGPLNDILFILLLFFLIAATLANPNIVKVNNPRGSKDAKGKQDITVTIDSKHQYYIGTKPVDKIMLDTLLKLEIEKYQKIRDTPSVVVNGDTASYYGEVYNVMNIAKKYKAKTAAHIKP